jgi:hypothetical protein
MKAFFALLALAFAEVEHTSTSRNLNVSSLI